MQRQQVVLRSLHSRWCVGLLLFSANFLWAQKQQSFEQILAVPIEGAVLHVPDLEGRRFPHHLAAKLPPIFETNQRETQSPARFFIIPVGYQHVFVNKKNNFDPRLPTRTRLLQSNGTFSSDGTPNRWLTFAPSYGRSKNQTNSRPRNLEYYGQRIPFAGPLILRVAKQAEAHPRVTRVVKILKPQF